MVSGGSGRNRVCISQSLNANYFNPQWMTEDGHILQPLGGVELVGSLCAQLCSVSDSTARPYALRFPTTIPRPIALLSGRSQYYQVSCAIIRSVALLLGQSHYSWVGRTIIGPSWCAFPPCFCSTPSHTLPHHSLQRFSLYLHASLFSFCHCNPGCLSLALALPYPCHLSLCYFSAVIPPFSLRFTI